MNVDRLVAVLDETDPRKGQKFDSGSIENSVPESNLDEPQGLRFTLLEELSEAVTEPSWLWQGFVAREALTVVAGLPKVGKSTLLFALLAAIRSGAPFLDKGTEQTGAVLLTEERLPTVRQKAQALGLFNSIPGDPLPIGPESNSKPPVYILGRHDTVGKPWVETVGEATAFAVGHGLGLLVVDTWNAWAGLSGESENAAGAVLNAVDPLGQAASAGLGVLLVAHQRKSGGQFGEGIRGSSALAGAVDVVVELERLRGDQHRSARIVRSVSRFPQTPDELTFTFTEQGQFEAFDPKAADAAAHRARALDALRDIGPSTANDVADVLDLDIRKTRGVLNELVGHGVTRNGKGVKGDPHVFEIAA